MIIRYIHNLRYITQNELLIDPRQVQSSQIVPIIIIIFIIIIISYGSTLRPHNPCQSSSDVEFISVHKFFNLLHSFCSLYITRVMAHI